MNDDLVRKVISMGDLFERLLINEIKLEYFQGDQKMSLQNHNDAILMAIKEMGYDISFFEEEKRCLADILRRQWDVLDQVHNDQLSSRERGCCAMQAQQMNKERVKYKNQINAKNRGMIELKSYGGKQSGMNEHSL